MLSICSVSHRRYDYATVIFCLCSFSATRTRLSQMSNRPLFGHFSTQQMQIVAVVYLIWIGEDSGPISIFIPSFADRFLKDVKWTPLIRRRGWYWIPPLCFPRVHCDDWGAVPFSNTDQSVDHPVTDMPRCLKEIALIYIKTLARHSSQLLAYNSRTAAY